MLLDRANSLRGRLRVHEIGTDRDGSHAFALQQIAGLASERIIKLEYGDLSTLPAEPQCDRTSDSVACAGHQRGLALVSRHSVSSSPLTLWVRMPRG